ncbi:MAG: hypothetical protein WC511_03160 [Candidatus Pacearchaeota archaeon]
MQEYPPLKGKMEFIEISPEETIEKKPVEYKQDDYYLEKEIKPEDLTCFYCLNKDSCPCSGDLYNTDGDCLWIK